MLDVKFAKIVNASSHGFGEKRPGVDTCRNNCTYAFCGKRGILIIYSLHKHYYKHEIFGLCSVNISLLPILGNICNCPSSAPVIIVRWDC